MGLPTGPKLPFTSACQVVTQTTSPAVVVVQSCKWDLQRIYNCNDLLLTSSSTEQTPLIEMETCFPFMFDSTERIRVQPPGPFSYKKPVAGPGKVANGSIGSRPFSQRSHYLGQGRSRLEAEKDGSSSRRIEMNMLRFLRTCSTA